MAYDGSDNLSTNFCGVCIDQLTYDWPNYITHYYEPKTGDKFWHQTCSLPDCKIINEDGHRCEQCHYFDYPEENPRGNMNGRGEKYLEDGSVDPESPAPLELSGGTDYTPYLIFLNPLDGRCTSDCSQEGRHYVNPFEFDRQATNDWNNEFRYRNSDAEYWTPYDPSEGPFECVCDADNGWVRDEIYDDGRCFDCHSIDENCGQCHFQYFH